MKDERLGIGLRTVPLKAPVDSAGTAFATAFVDMKNALHATFYDYLGVITAASADQNIVITMEVSATSASGSEVAIAFTYRISAATGTDTWGAPTAVAATGLSLDTTTKDGMMIQIDVNPAAFDAAVAGGHWVRLVQGIDAGGTVTLNSIFCQYEPMYAQATIPTAL